MRVDQLRGKRIAILGAGREGQATYHWLKHQLGDCNLPVFAETPAEAEFVQSLLVGDSIQIGKLSEAPLEDFEVLLRSPGISPYRPELQRVQAAGAQITSPSSLWFASHPDAKTICVTGTKGKSTTSALTAHMLRACGQRVQLAGNIGMPLLACDDADVDWWVIELSSYQLSDLQARPTIGVLLNFSPEHLDWHGGLAGYRRDKLRLAGLTASGGLVINAADSVLSAEFSSLDSVSWFNSPQGIRTEDREFRDGESRLEVCMPDHMPGKHNRSNVAAALTAVRKAGFELAPAIASLSSYESLPHRLQVLGERQGVTWINDSIASTPVATSAALESLAGKSVVLLVGGLDRGLDWSIYLRDFHAHTPKALIAMPDNGPAVIKTLKQLGIVCRAGEHLAPG
ncbi:MAG TPA: UDP-N-acetylmuramoyl-L-alanine--D-glutamate ligase, partial [Xanthomonadales bacterium]|nr:UDP-N-acetylmuramoyl-L-alanine--D-glutamate ligase [Xanthomonadales bacterium]